MSLFVLADLHLCQGNPEKTMSIFSGWKDYQERIEKHWLELITDDDTVVLPGDISWGMSLAEAAPDFHFIERLPGKKIIIKGNHDYWWTTMKKMEEYFASKGFNNLEFVRTNVLEAEGCLITGTRGWMIETRDAIEGSDNRKIYEREKLRIKMCIDVINEADPDHAKKHILMIHYPPVTANQEFTEFAEMISSGGIDICVYGHLHGKAHKKAFEGDFGGCRFICTSADYVGFKPVRIV